jgi:hypothetical protein
MYARTITAGRELVSHKRAGGRTSAAGRLS